MSSSGRLYAWTNERQNPSQAKLDGFLFSLDREGLFLTWFASALPCSLSFKRINTKSGTRTVGNAKGALQCQNLGGSLSMKALNVGFSLTLHGDFLVNHQSLSSTTHHSLNCGFVRHAFKFQVQEYMVWQSSMPLLCSFGKSSNPYLEPIMVQGFAISSRNWGRSWRHETNQFLAMFWNKSRTSWMFTQQLTGCNWR